MMCTFCVCNNEGYRYIYLVELFKRFDSKLSAACFNRLFPIGIAFSNKSGTLVSNVQPRRCLSATFPALIHVLHNITLLSQSNPQSTYLMIPAFRTDTAHLKTIETVSWVTFIFVQSDTVVIPVSHG